MFRRIKALMWQYNAILLCIIALLLYSCSNVSSRHDGPPSYYVNEKLIPNAVPKDEPLSAYGNPPSYTIDGKTYKPMTSSKGYVEIGMASWYGTKFHKKRTSSGEPYNMLAMTAAHKTLPLPTYVQVTNLKNGKQIIVKINDRGPFYSDRIIDLSYVAAKKLGILDKGTGLVKIEAINPPNQ